MKEIAKFSELNKQALAIKTILKMHGWEVGILKVRELLAVSRGVASWDLLCTDFGQEAEPYKDDLCIALLSAIYALTDAAFQRPIGAPHKCRLLTERETNTFYGIELDIPGREEPLKLTIENYSVAGVGGFFALEILQALAENKRRKNRH